MNAPRITTPDGAAGSVSRGFFPSPVIIMVLLAIIILTSNPFFGVVSIFSLLTLRWFFWTREQPAIIFWALAYQWIQVNSPLFHASFLGVEFREVFRFRTFADESYILGSIGLLAFAFGIWIVTRGTLNKSLKSWFDILNPSRCLWAYVYFVFAYGFISLISFSGAGQLLIALGFLKWGFFYIFFCSVLHSGENKFYLILFVVLEFLFSLFSIFASFKAILIMPFVMLPVFFRRKILLVDLLKMGVLIVTLIGVALLWTAVKMDYREFMAAGESGQVINVGRGAAMSELARLVAQVDMDKIKIATEEMSERLSYLDFLSGVLGHVPSSLPHENGAVTMAAVTHVLTPRVFFPEKEAIHDSIFLNKYVGEFIADYRTTSMSIGYVGDFYIDFGWYAPVGIFLFGLLLGYIYLTLFRLGESAGWGIFLIMPMFFFLYLFEISLIKMVGQVMTYTLLMFPTAIYGLGFIRAYVERKALNSTSGNKASLNSGPSK